jgi:hypothetical protein
MLVLEWENLMVGNGVEIVCQPPNKAKLDFINQFNQYYDKGRLL